MDILSQVIFLKKPSEGLDKIKQTGHQVQHVNQNKLMKKGSKIDSPANFLAYFCWKNGSRRKGGFCWKSFRSG